MKTKNTMQLKAYIRNKAKETGTTSQLIMQNYLLERLLDSVKLRWMVDWQPTGSSRAFKSILFA